jgi:hypothetical protein
MDRVYSRVRKPVKREAAERYVLLTLFSFAASVSLTRLFLWATGYPQVGRGELHIAHVLWGGLLLFAAALLMLVLANRWVYRMGALLAGAGVGLFIDEVGKFITKSNDYFYPAAAPIVYVFFLLTALLYLQVRRPPSTDARAELYHAFDDLQEVVDHDLDREERAALEARLSRIAERAPSPDLRRLASELLQFVQAESLYLAPDVPGVWERGLNRWRAWQARWLGRRRFQTFLAVGLLVLGLVTLADLGELLWALRSPAYLADVVARLISRNHIASATGLIWFYAHLTLQGVVGVSLLAAVGLFVLQRERQGLQLGAYSLALSLTAMDLLVFYYEQFSAILPALAQFALLMGVIQYRRRFV